MNLRDIAALIKVVKLFVVLNCYLKEHNTFQLGLLVTTIEAILT